MKKILLVDDEEVLLWSLSKELSKTYDVFTAKNGLAAVEVLQNNVGIELLITDIRMPEMDGLELIEAAKHIVPRIKIVVMTAFGSPDLQEEASKLGSLFYLEKPFVVDKLLNVIVEATDEGFAGTVMSLQFEDVLQLICLGRKSVSLQIRQKSEEGLILFRDGQIIHASCGEVEGEEAFYNLCFWNAGHFEMLPYQEPDYQTIFHSTEYMLFEGMKRKDERQRDNAESDICLAAGEAVLTDEEKRSPAAPAEIEEKLQGLLSRPEVENIVLLDKNDSWWKPMGGVLDEDSLNLHRLLGDTCDKLGEIFGESFSRRIDFSGSHPKIGKLHVSFVETDNLRLALHCGEAPDNRLKKEIEDAVKS